MIQQVLTARERQKWRNVSRNDEKYSFSFLNISVEIL